MCKFKSRCNNEAQLIEMRRLWDESDTSILSSIWTNIPCDYGDFWFI